MTLKDKAQGLINKVEAALDNKKNTSNTTPTTTSTSTTGTTNNAASSNYGPHSSNLANKADPRVDSDLDNRGTTHATGQNNTFGSSTGPTYSSNTSNTYDNPSSTNAGPHNSNLVNKLDPRVDSDRDGRNDPSSRVGGYGNTQTNDNYGSTTTASGTSNYNNTQSTNAGPHNSNIANKLDPRVDSDRDGRNDPSSRVGGYGNTQTDNTYGDNSYGTNTTGGNNYNNTPSTGLNDNPRSTNAGPHSSNIANKLDPRVDSDRDGRNDPSSRVGGYGNTQTDNSYGGNSYGDKTYGSNTTGGGNTYSGTSTGLNDNPRSTNAGPHGSNLLNKLDPRVDSDRDGAGITQREAY